MQHGGVDVGDVVAVLDGVEAELVGRAVDDAALDAAAGHPDGEAERMVVAAVGLFLRPGRAAELGGPDDDRLIEQAALLQVAQQARDRLVDFGAELASGSSSGRCARPRRCPAAVIDLHEPDAALDKPAGGEATVGQTSWSPPDRGRKASGSRRSRPRNFNASGTAICMRNASS